MGWHISGEGQSEFRIISLSYNVETDGGSEGLYEHTAKIEISNVKGKLRVNSYHLFPNAWKTQRQL
jgi:hypothetical protein